MEFQIGQSVSLAAPDRLFFFLLLWFVVLSAARHNDEGGRVEDFNYSAKVKELVEV